MLLAFLDQGHWPLTLTFHPSIWAEIFLPIKFNTIGQRCQPLTKERSIFEDEKKVFLRMKKKVFWLEKQYFSFCFHRSVHKLILEKKSILRHFAQNHKYLNLKKILNTAKKEQLASLHSHLHSMWSILIDHIRHIFWYPIHTCYVWDQAVQQEKNSGEIGAFFTEIFFFISVVILN